MIKLHVHNHIMVIYFHYECHEIPSIAYKVMAEERKALKCRQLKGNDSFIADCTLMELYAGFPAASLNN